MKLKLLLLFALLANISLCYSGTHSFSSKNWSILEEKGCDGSIKILLIRHTGDEHTWGREKDLYLQYRNKSGQWKDICYIHHFINGGHRYTTSEVSPFDCSFENRNFDMGYDYYGYVVKIINPPNPNERVSYRWIQKIDNDYMSDTKYAEAYKPKAVQNLTATKNEGCRIVKLSWDRPSNVDESAVTSYLIEYTLNGETYVSGSTSKLNYTHTSSSKFYKGEYRIKAKISCEDYNFNEGEISQAIEGYGYLAIAPPTNFKVESLCERTVRLSWNKVPDEHATKYVIEYADNPDFSSSSKWYIDESKNSIEESLPETFLTYYFRIRTVNTCNAGGNWSSTVEQFISDLPDAVSQINYTIENNAFRFNWEDTEHEEEYIIERINVNDPSDTEEFEIEKNFTEYTDETVQFCTSYRYNIYSQTECGRTKTEVPEILTLTPDLSDYLSNLDISKGYYSNRVELKWEMNSTREISNIKISRKIKGTDQLENIATIDPDQTQWTDNNTDANILYEYQVEGILNCGEETVYTNTLTETGFRTPFGTILGSVNFDGGNPVENVEVLVNEDSDTQNNKSIFLGSNKGELHIPNSESLKGLTEVSAQIWVKPEPLGYGHLIKHFDSENRVGYYLTITSHDIGVIFGYGYGYDYGIPKTYNTNYALPTNKFTNVGLVISESKIKVFANGEKIGEFNHPRPIEIPDSDIILNSGSLTNMYVDELSLFKRAKTDEEMRRDFNRKLDAKEKDLLVYLQMDEGVGEYVYDSSNDGVEYNKNHARIFGGEWSDIAPSSDQLSYKGITDENGNYTVNFIRYSGSGNTFEVTPVKDIHQFQPAVQNCFLGEGSTSAEKNFEDISSFKVTGNVVYTLDQANCPTEGVQLLIDDNVVTKNGQPVTTDQNGEFEIQVPIGKHVISVQKTGHTFESTTYPSNGEPKDFRENISGIEFKNTTAIKVAGRVVGGTREGEKPIGFGLSKNNIGVATLTFQSENQCFQKSITTDPGTGEYEIDLLPVNFIVSGLQVDNDDVFFEPEDYADVLPLADHILEQEDVYQPEEETEEQKYKYNCKKIFTYRASPSVNVSLSNGTAFEGEKSLEYITDSQTGESVVLDLTDKPFGYPVVVGSVEYDLKISAYEEYMNPNTDPVFVDRVPITDGLITIANDLGDSDEIENEGNLEKIQLDNEDGAVAYKFTTGEPILTENNEHPERSYTGALKVSLEADGNLAEWKTEDGDYFRAYVLGQKKKGNSFVTTGPENVKWILRDPPGSGSHSFLSAGSTLTDITQTSFHETLQDELVLSFDLGNNIIVGGGLAGPQIQTEIRNTTEWTNTFQQSAGRNDICETSITFEQELTTSDDNNIVGTDMDLFIGYAQNLIYGESESFNLVPLETINQHNLHSTSHELTINEITYKLAISPEFYLNPSGFSTMFIYSQKHIEEIIIPDLIKIRDGFFERENSAYSSNVNKTSPLYGSNNDDERWGSQASSDTPKTTEEVDFNGPSYTFDSKSQPNKIDSVRWYNQQIRLWEESLAQNEKEKIETTKIFADNDNVSFVGGGQTYTYSQTTSKTKSKEEYFDITLATEFAIKFGTWFNSTGVANTNTLSIIAGGGGTFTETETTTNTFGYTFSDPDVGDSYTVDILDPESGNGPVFKLKAGQTACPFEPATISKYYNPGTEINPATKQREVIKLVTESSDVLSSISPDESANYTLNLINDSETGDASWFGLRVVEGSNPNGATIKVNGAPIGSFMQELQAGVTSQVQLTLDKNQEYDNYEDVKIMAYSECEFDNYHNYGKIFAADTVSLSAYFIPQCGNLSIATPQNNWILNRESNNNMEILVEGVGSIDESFESFIIQYRASGTTNWINLQKYLVDYDPDTADENEQEILSGVNTIKYNWNTEQVLEGNYEIRILSTCQAGITSESKILKGTIDREPPVIIGNPDPILEANQTIRFLFNEDIRTELINNLNFDIRGILNGTAISHNVSGSFDGINGNVLIRTNGRESEHSFTIEMWAMRVGSGNQILFAQGSGTDNAFEFRFNDQNEFTVWYANTELAKSEPVTANEWFHYAVTYNSETKLVTLFKNGTNEDTHILNENLTRTGDIRLGRSSQADQNFFTGYLHELRFWSQDRLRAEIARNMSTRLSGNELLLTGLWRFDEGTGSISQDHVQGNHAIFNADWAITPQGKSVEFGGNNSIEIESGDLAFREDEKFSIEFWMNTSNQQTGYLFSNGNGLNAETPSAWSVGLNSNGNLVIENSGESYTVNDIVLTDGNWHHIAISLNRPGACNVYFDSELVSTIPSAVLGGLGGAKMWLGAKGEISSIGTETVNNYFSGLIDDFRIWSYNKDQSFIKRDMQIRLNGDSNNDPEPGLVFYLPFETYVFDMGVAELTGSVEDESVSQLQITNHGASLNQNTPSLQLPRPIEKVNFTLQKSEREIAILLTDDMSRIEKTTLDVTIDNIYDKFQNKILSPGVYNVFVNQNQLKWDENEMELKSKTGESTQFTINVINSGTTPQDYFINNLPAWLEVSSGSGSIDGNSSVEIEFTVHEGLNTGYYEEQFYLIGNGDYNEHFFLDLIVEGEKPDWEENLDNFRYSMSIVGQIVENGVMSSDENDMVAAYVGNELRGVAKPIYDKVYDKYLVYLNVGSNDDAAEPLSFKVWKANNGTTHLVSGLSINFNSDEPKGSVETPVNFQIGNSIESTIDINQGWNWISINLEGDDNDIKSVFSNMGASEGDQIVCADDSDYTYTSNSWTGDDSDIDFTSMYKVFAAEATQLRLTGTPVDPLTTSINIEAGENWIGYLPQVNLEVNEALSNFDASHNDEIKTNGSLARYDAPTQKWMGTLEYLKPGEGYMLRTASGGSFYYPEKGILTKSGQLSEDELPEEKTRMVYNTESNMTMVASLIDENGKYVDARKVSVWSGNQLLSITEKITGPDDNAIFCLSIPANDNIQEIRFTYEDEKGSNKPVLSTFESKAGAAMGELRAPELLLVNAAREDEIKVYPNPFQDGFSIEFNMKQEQLVKIELLNVLGKSIVAYNKELEPGKQVVNFNDQVQHLPAGIYIIRISKKDGVIHQKIIKK